MYLARRLNREGGFTLAEIFVAGIILAVALIPIVGMFDTSFRGIRNLENVRASVECAKAAMEEIRSIPFYEPYNESFGDVDIDDHFWGSRDPLNSNPGESTPDWESIPEVEYYTRGAFEGYGAFRVGVQLAYLEDDTGVATLKDDWGPKTVGKDRPTDSDNASLHLLLVRVSTYWMSGGQEKSYSIEGIVTDSEAIYNLGISGIEVLGPASIQDLDENGEVRRSNAAAHWSDPNVDVQVEIKGWGFDPAATGTDEIKAWLVRDKNNDIPITLTYKDETTLRGTLRLHNTGTQIPGETDWYPKAAIGYWSVKVRQLGIMSTYLYEGFICQYPKPVISDFGNEADMSKAGPNFWDAASLRIVGGPFPYIAKDPAVRLIRYGDNDEILDQINGTVDSVTAPAGTSGYSDSPNCEIMATFDFTTASPGDYYLEVVNTDEATLVGHVASDFKGSAVYTIEEAVPVVTDVYVYGTDPKARSCYRNIGNPWRLVIEGRYFNMAGTPPVEVWICREVPGGLPGGNMAQGAVQAVYNNNTIIADFDFSGLPEGAYKAYVKNLNNGASGWTDGAPFTLTTFSAGISSFTPDAGHGFYENYYDVPSKITGTGLLAATGVTITNGTVEYDAGGYTKNSNEQISVNLNLIACDNTHDWKVRVHFAEDYYLEEDFDVTLGPAIILPPSDTKHAVRIYAERRTGWPNYEAGWHNETTSDKAWAWSGIQTLWWWNEGYATFDVKGMGFPLNSRTNLRVWGTGLDVSGFFDCAEANRETKTVRIRSARWLMPRDRSGLYGIEVYREGDSGNKDTYADRWQLVK